MARAAVFYDGDMGVDEAGRASAEDDEPERQLPQRTSPPAKKPLADFLAEFERRLAAEPDRPATDAFLELEARAEGARHKVRPPLPETEDAAEPIPATAEPIAEAAEPVAEAAPPAELTPEAAPPSEPEATEPEAATTSPVGAIRQRMRRRRHRRRKH